MGFRGVLAIFVALALGDLLLTATRTSLYRGRNSGLTVYMTLAAHELVLVLQFACLIILLSRSYWVFARMLRELVSAVKVALPLLLIKGFLTAFPAVYRDVLLPRKRSARNGSGDLVTTSSVGGVVIVPTYAIRGWSDGGYGVLVVLDLLFTIAYTLSCFHVVFFLAEKSLYPPYHLRRNADDNTNEKASASGSGGGGGGKGADINNNTRGGGVWGDGASYSSHPADSLGVSRFGQTMGRPSFVNAMNTATGEGSATLTSGIFGTLPRGSLGVSGGWWAGERRLHPGAQRGSVATAAPAGGEGRSYSRHVHVPAMHDGRGKQSAGGSPPRSARGNGASSAKGGTFPCSVGFQLPGEARARAATPPSPENGPPPSTTTPGPSPTSFTGRAEADFPATGQRARQQQQQDGVAASVGHVSPLELPHKFTTSNAASPPFVNSFAAALLQSGFDSQHSTGSMMVPSSAWPLYQRARQQTSNGGDGGGGGGGGGLPSGGGRASNSNNDDETRIMPASVLEGSYEGGTAASRRPSMLSNTAKLVLSHHQQSQPAAARPASGQHFVVDQATGQVIPRSSGGGGGTTSTEPPQQEQQPSLRRDSSLRRASSSGGFGQSDRQPPGTPSRQAKYNPLQM